MSNTQRDQPERQTAAETKKTLEDPISKNKPRKRVLEHLALQLQT